MNPTDLYKHKHFGNLVQITALGGSWVEFLSNGSLFWLEQLVFDQAYTYYRDGDPITADLMALRAQAQATGILVPKEIQAVYIDIED
jgi:hypothetical protein